MMINMRPCKLLCHLQSYIKIFRYQTEHFFSGFIGLPFGQLKSFAKSSLFDSDPKIRNPPGECAPVLICFLYAPSRYFEHQTCPQLIQNSCFGVKLCPGNVCSSHSVSSFLTCWSFSQSTSNEIRNNCYKGCNLSWINEIWKNSNHS